MGATMPDDKRASATLDLPYGDGRQVDISFPPDISPEEWDVVDRYVRLYMALRETEEIAA